LNLLEIAPNRRQAFFKNDGYPAQSSHGNYSDLLFNVVAVAGKIMGKPSTFSRR